MKIKYVQVLSTILVLLGAAHGCLAAVTAEEAAKLKTTLTPIGAERAGNKDGSIPAWTGGDTKVPAGYKPGGDRADSFSAEKPMFSITAKNIDQYKVKLNEGMLALFKKYPEYRIDVYPSHRTAAEPQWLYDYTFKNATTATLGENGRKIENAFGGVPFPIPRTGQEVVWNHLVRWQGAANINEFRAYVAVSGRTPVETGHIIAQTEQAYYAKDKTNFNGDYFSTMLFTVGPPHKAGELSLLRDNIDQSLSGGRKAWQYVPGQRRVRKAPIMAYDSPDLATSGTIYFDEHQLMIGPLDRFDWKLIGKQEMYIPYNTNKSYLCPDLDLVGANYFNPDKVRWELHRVWVVEGNVASGQRHTVPKKRFYIDEDTWMVVLYDGWDAEGKLWKVGIDLPMNMPDMPGSVAVAYGQINLATNRFAVAGISNSSETKYKIVERRGGDFFTPDALLLQGVR